MNLKLLEDAILLEQLRTLVLREREDTAEIVEHLAEVESRDLALKLAFPSLFVYCVRELGYTEAAAYYRIRAARAARRFPQIIPMLKQGEISLEAVVRLHPHLESPNAAKLLETARGKSTRDVETMVAEIAPKPARPDFARVIAVSGGELPGANAPQPTLPLGNPALIQEEPRRADPDAVKRVSFAFTADEELLILLKRAQEILRHKYPFGRFEDIFRDALILLLEKKDPNRRLLGKMPKGTATAT